MEDDDDGSWFFGTDPRFLHRASSSWTSIKAAYSVDTKKLEQMMYEAICRHGKRGCIADDLIEEFPWLPYSSITARPSALERYGLIIRGPDERTGKAGVGQLVMRKSKFADKIIAIMLELKDPDYNGQHSRLQPGEAAGRAAQE